MVKLGPETYFRLLSRLRLQGGFSLQGFGAIDVIAGKDFLGEFPVTLGAAGSRVIQRHRFAVAWGFRQTDVARDCGLEQLAPKNLRRFSVTCCARFVRSSYMVRITPSISSVGLNAAWMRPSVVSNSEIPSSAKYSACMGTSSRSAATRAFNVRRSSAGGHPE